MIYLCMVYVLSKLKENILKVLEILFNYLWFFFFFIGNYNFILK